MGRPDYVHAADLKHDRADAAARRRAWLERKQLSDHLADQHGVYYTRREFESLTLDDLEATHALHDSRECGDDWPI